MTFISENGVRKAVKEAFTDGLFIGSFILVGGVFQLFVSINIFITLFCCILSFVVVFLVRDSYIEQAVNKVKEGNQ